VKKDEWHGHFWPKQFICLVADLTLILPKNIDNSGYKISEEIILVILLVIIF
jgi:hypothetical protein